MFLRRAITLAAVTSFLAHMPVVAAEAFTCDSVTVSGATYDLSPLSGLRSVSKESATPPTTIEANARMNICSALDRQDGVADEDQCAEGTRVCLVLLNHKPSSAEPDRVTAVIPFWTADTTESDIVLSTMGARGAEGLQIVVTGPEYAGLRQTLNLTLICAADATDPSPSLVSYFAGALALEWSTPDACPRSPGDSDEDGGTDGRSGGGFFGFVKFMFWLVVFSLVAYFGVGILYNHQQYSARGWDLIPHRDFWRELPVLFSDLGSHLFANVRSSTGRGGYSSLG